MYVFSSILGMTMLQQTHLRRYDKLECTLQPTSSFADVTKILTTSVIQKGQTGVCKDRNQQDRYHYIPPLEQHVLDIVKLSMREKSDNMLCYFTMDQSWLVLLNCTKGVSIYVALCYLTNSDRVRSISSCQISQHHMFLLYQWLKYNCIQPIPTVQSIMRLLRAKTSITVATATVVLCLLL